MEAKKSSAIATGVEPAALFSDLVRLETDLWDLVDRRLRSEHHLPLSWFEPMQVIDRVSECRVADIARELSITVGGTSKLVDRIERAGWCRRSPNPDDARSSHLALTRSGSRLLKEAHDTFEDELQLRLGAALTPQRLQAFAASMRDIRRHIADQQGST